MDTETEFALNLVRGAFGNVGSDITPASDALERAIGTLKQKDMVKDLITRILEGKSWWLENQEGACLALCAVLEKSKSVVLDRDQPRYLLAAILQTQSTTLLPFAIKFLVRELSKLITKAEQSDHVEDEDSVLFNDCVKVFESLFYLGDPLNLHERLSPLSKMSFTSLKTDEKIIPSVYQQPGYLFHQLASRECSALCVRAFDVLIRKPNIERQWVYPTEMLVGMLCRVDTLFRSGGQDEPDLLSKMLYFHQIVEIRDFHGTVYSPYNCSFSPVLVEDLFAWSFPDGYYPKMIEFLCHNELGKSRVHSVLHIPSIVVVIHLLKVCVQKCTTDEREMVFRERLHAENWLPGLISFLSGGDSWNVEGAVAECFGTICESERVSKIFLPHFGVEQVEQLVEGSPACLCRCAEAGMLGNDIEWFIARELSGSELTGDFFPLDLPDIKITILRSIHMGRQRVERVRERSGSPDLLFVHLILGYLNGSSYSWSAGPSPVFIEFLRSLFVPLPDPLKSRVMKSIASSLSSSSIDIHILSNLLLLCEIFLNEWNQLEVSDELVSLREELLLVSSKAFATTDDMWERIQTGAIRILVILQRVVPGDVDMTNIGSMISFLDITASQILKDPTSVDLLEHWVPFFSSLLKTDDSRVFAVVLEHFMYMVSYVLPTTHSILTPECTHLLAHFLNEALLYWESRLDELTQMYISEQLGIKDVGLINMLHIIAPLGPPAMTVFTEMLHGRHDLIHSVYNETAVIMIPLGQWAGEEIVLQHLRPAPYKSLIVAKGVLTTCLLFSKFMSLECSSRTLGKIFTRYPALSRIVRPLLLGPSCNISEAKMVHLGAFLKAVRDMETISQRGTLENFCNYWLTEMRSEIQGGWINVDLKLAVLPLVQDLAAILKRLEISQIGFNLIHDFVQLVQQKDCLISVLLDVDISRLLIQTYVTSQQPWCASLVEQAFLLEASQGGLYMTKAAVFLDPSQYVQHPLSLYKIFDILLRTDHASVVLLCSSVLQEIMDDSEIIDGDCHGSVELVNLCVNTLQNILVHENMEVIRDSVKTPLSRLLSRIRPSSSKPLITKDAEESPDVEVEIKKCTFLHTGDQYEDQHWYHCITCKLVNEKGCCAVCVKRCHKDHEVTYARRSRFFCDCGAEGKCVSTKSSFKKRKPKPQEESLVEEVFDLEKVLGGSKESKTDSSQLFETYGVGVMLTQVHAWLSSKPMETLSTRFGEKSCTDEGMFLVKKDLCPKKILAIDSKGHLFVAEGTAIRCLSIGALLCDGSLNSRGRMYNACDSKVPENACVPLYRMTLNFIVLQIEFNPWCDTFVALVGSSRCLVLTLSERGGVISKSQIETGLAMTDKSVTILGVKWIGYSMSHLMLVTTGWIKVFDLSEDLVSPCRYYEFEMDINNFTCTYMLPETTVVYVALKTGLVVCQTILVDGKVADESFFRVSCIQEPVLSLHAPMNAPHPTLFVSYANGTTVRLLLDPKDYSTIVTTETYNSPLEMYIDWWSSCDASGERESSVIGVFQNRLCLVSSSQQNVVDFTPQVLPSDWKNRRIVGLTMWPPSWTHSSAAFVSKLGDVSKSYFSKLPDVSKVRYDMAKYNESAQCLLVLYDNGQLCRLCDRPSYTIPVIKDTTVPPPPFVFEQLIPVASHRALSSSFSWGGSYLRVCGSAQRVISSWQDNPSEHKRTIDSSEFFISAQLTCPGYALAALRVKLGSTGSKPIVVTVEPLQRMIQVHCSGSDLRWVDIPLTPVEILLLLPRNTLNIKIDKVEGFIIDSVEAFALHISSPSWFSYVGRGIELLDGLSNTNENDHISKGKSTCLEILSVYDSVQEIYARTILFGDGKPLKSPSNIGAVVHCCLDQILLWAETNVLTIAQWVQCLYFMDYIGRIHPLIYSQWFSKHPDFLRVLSLGVKNKIVIIIDSSLSMSVCLLFSIHKALFLLIRHSFEACSLMSNASLFCDIACDLLEHPSTFEIRLMVTKSVKIVLKQFSNKKVDEEDSSVQYRCDVCGACPLKMFRWHCTVCEDFDLCENCLSQNCQTHKSTHAMTPLKTMDNLVFTDHVIQGFVAKMDSVRGLPFVCVAKLLYHFVSSKAVVLNHFVNRFIGYVNNREEHMIEEIWLPVYLIGLRCSNNQLKKGQHKDLYLALKTLLLTCVENSTETLPSENVDKSLLKPPTDNHWFGSALSFWAFMFPKEDVISTRGNLLFGGRKNLLIMCVSLLKRVEMLVPEDDDHLIKLLLNLVNDPRFSFCKKKSEDTLEVVCKNNPRFQRLYRMEHFKRAIDVLVSENIDNENQESYSSILPSSFSMSYVRICSMYKTLENLAALSGSNDWVLYCASTVLPFQVLISYLRKLPQQGTILVLTMLMNGLCQEMHVDYFEKLVYDPLFLNLLVDRLLVLSPTASIRVTAARVFERLRLHGVRNPVVKAMLKDIIVSKLSTRYVGKHFGEMIVLIQSMKEDLTAKDMDRISQFASFFFTKQHSSVEQLRSKQISALIRCKGPVKRTILPPNCYSEEESCPSCRVSDRLFKPLTLKDSKHEIKYTSNSMLVGMDCMYTMTELTVEVSLQQKGVGSGVRSIQIYCSSIPAQDVSSVADWKHISHIDFSTKASSKFVANFPLPITLCYLKFEFETTPELVFSQNSERQTCPRCANIVGDPSGVCRCGEIVYQCRNCRRINQEDRNAFLCVDCGYCRYARFDTSMSACIASDYPAIVTDKECGIALSHFEALEEVAAGIQSAMVGLRETANAQTTHLWNSLGGSGFCNELIPTVPSSSNSGMERLMVLDSSSLENMLKSIHENKTAEVVVASSESDIDEEIQKRISRRFGSEKQISEILNRLRSSAAASSSKPNQLKEELFPSNSIYSRDDLYQKYLLTRNAMNRIVTQMIAYIEPDVSTEQPIDLVSHYCCTCTEETVQLFCGLIGKDFVPLLWARGVSVNAVGDLDVVGNTLVKFANEDKDTAMIILKYIEEMIGKACRESLSHGNWIAGGMALLFTLAKTIDEAFYFVLRLLNEYHLGSIEYVLSICLPAIECIRECTNRYEGLWSCFIEFQNRKWYLTKKKQYDMRWLIGMFSSGGCDNQELNSSSGSLVMEMFDALKNDDRLFLSDQEVSLLKGLAWASLRKQSADFFDAFSDILARLGKEAYAFLVGKEYHRLLIQVLNKEVVALYELDQSIVQCPIRLAHTSTRLECSFAFRLASLLSMIFNYNELVAYRSKGCHRLLLDSYVRLLCMNGLKGTMLLQTVEHIVGVAKILETIAIDRQDSEFFADCGHLLEEQVGSSARYMKGVLDELCAILNPVQELPHIFMRLIRSRSQDDYFPGCLERSQISIDEITDFKAVEPTMRDLRWKIACDLDMKSAVELLELLVGDKIINLDLPIRLVHTKVWKPYFAKRGSDIVKKQKVFVPDYDDEIIDEEEDDIYGYDDEEEIDDFEFVIHTNKHPMEVTYRLQGIDGEATEDIVQTLTDEEENSEETPETKFSNSILMSGSLKACVNYLKNPALNKGTLVSMLQFLEYCCNCSSNRQKLVDLNAIPVLLQVLMMVSVDDVSSERLVLILEVLITELSNSESDQKNTDLLGLFLEHLDMHKANASRLNQTMSRLLPFLTFGKIANITLLLDRFQAALDSDDSEWVTWSLEGMGVDNGSHAFRSAALERGFTRKMVEKLKSLHSSLETGEAKDPKKRIAQLQEWRTNMAKEENMVSLLLALLTGLSHGHQESQTYLLNAGITKMAFELEQVPGIIGENADKFLASSVRENVEVQNYVTQLKQERSTLKKRIQKRNKKKDIKNNKWLQEMESLEEESGPKCSVCQEGLLYKPDQVMGIYVFSKSIPVEPHVPMVSVDSILSPVLHQLTKVHHPIMDTLKTAFPEFYAYWSCLPESGIVEHYTISNKRLSSTSTVSCFNCIHVTCHDSAVQHDKAHPKAPKGEWEGAELRNAQTKCNNILPLKAKASQPGFDRLLDRYFLPLQTYHALSTILFDIRALILRFAHGGSLSEDTNGGGPESNFKLLIELVHVKSYLWDLLSDDDRALFKSILFHFLGQSGLILSSSKKRKRLEDGPRSLDFLMCALIALSICSPEEWLSVKVLFGKAILENVHYKQESEKCTNRPFLIAYQIVDCLFTMKKQTYDADFLFRHYNNLVQTEHLDCF